MNRRQFLNITFPATGAILVTPGLMNSKVLEEINSQFSSQESFDKYDLVINGAGLSGYFAAIHAAKQGKKVLIVDKRTSPGFEIAAKGKLWLKADGYHHFTPEMTQLFFPTDEKQEIHHSSGKGPNGSQFGDELLLFSGSIRKGMVRNLLLNQVHLLLMTDVCGILSDHKRVQGVLMASKHGLHTVKCRGFIDASDNVLLSRELAGENYQINKAGFVLEILKVRNPEKKNLPVDNKFGLINNELKLHPGKHVKDQLFVQYEYPVKSQHQEKIEQQARMIAADLGKSLPTLDNSLKDAIIEQFPLETSLFLKENNLPEPVLDGHYILAHSYEDLSCRDVLTIESEAQKTVDNIKFLNNEGKAESIIIPGTEIAFDQVSLSDLNEPGLSVPLRSCQFNYNLISHHAESQVLVAGGGTAGAMAAMGSVEKGADTIVIDYFNDLGGTKTMGGVMGYYHGFKDHKFFKKQDADNAQEAAAANMSKKTGRKLYHLKNVLNGGGQFVSGAILCGTFVKDQKVEGILICRNGKLQLLKSAITIDATGDGDIAFFAGAKYQHGNSRTGKTQNYSQWDIKGGADQLTSPTNRDYDIIENTKISELQRGLFLSHYQAHFYDFHPFLTVRESRRIEGLHILDLIDAVEGTHFKDVISFTSSDFDPHYVGSSEYSRCGFLLPHSNDLVMEIPYRAIVPKELDGMLISGRGISQTHNALQFTRMSADLAVLGYLTGQIAADQAWQNIQPKDYDISNLQKEWVTLGYLPNDYITKEAGNKIHKQDEIRRRIKKLSEGAPEYLYEVARLPKEKTLSELIQYFESVENPDGKLLLAKALAWYGDSEGNYLIEQELKEMFEQELRKGYPNGFVDTYDDIRGREKNMLVGLFWRINQNIGLLAMTDDKSPIKTIKYILENTASGGEMVDRESEYYDHRIDLKIVPFHNRIFNLCFYAERNPDPTFIRGFEKLLSDPHIKNHITEEYQHTRWRVYGGDLELFIAAALARSGGKAGFDLLSDYLDDIHYNFKEFALNELQNLTTDNYKYDSQAWKDYFRELSWPQPCKKLKKEIEV